MRGDRFRVMTPNAVERTSLEKDRRSDTGSVMYGKAHDIKDKTRNP
jgi:hypothetical protein